MFFVAICQSKGVSSHPGPSCGPSEESPGTKEAQIYILMKKETQMGKMKLFILLAEKIK